MPAGPERLTSALADRYRIERELGAGGMATVYLAQDLKHDRKVAIKVLRPELAAVIGAERFLSEIKTTANLQHPQILPLHDSGESDGFLFYVMPFIEGESLRDRLTREKQLPIPDAVRLATEVAGALDYAHRHHVIHRDIKPENILLHDGHALVADFGIALAASKAGSTRMTETGMSLGTPHYMSPEQAMGEREITARSDVYALGCVTYEMLTGDPPFTGSTAQAIVARVLTEQPRPLALQRHTIPEGVEVAVMTALEKLPADRYASAAEFAAALTSAHVVTRHDGRTVVSRAARKPATPLDRARRWSPLVTVLGFAGLAAWGWSRPAPDAQVIRYSLTAIPGQEVRSGVAGINIAISPDGRWIAYVGSGPNSSRIYLRSRDRLDAVAVPGTEGATNPFFSPDGSQLAFHVGPNYALTTVPVAGGPVTLLDPGSPGSGGGGAWSDDGYIYYDTFDGIGRIRAGGGELEPVVSIDTAARELGFAWPEALPDGRGLLFRARRNLNVTDFVINAFDLRTRTRHVLMSGLAARYVAPGYLVVLRADGVLVAAPFDLEKLAVTGPPVPLINDVLVKPLGSADVALSRTGTLVYLPGGGLNSDGILEVVTVERTGRIISFSPPLTYNPSANRGLALSPDGRQLALDLLNSVSSDIWVKTLPSGPLSRLTFDSLGAIRPQWSADGRYVYYISQGTRTGRGEVWRIRGDGSAAAERVWADPNGVVMAFSLSRDGKWLVYRVSIGGTGRDIYAARLGVDTLPTPLLTGSFWEDSPALSPDGRWLAYTSMESSREEVYVRPFPNVNEGRWQISTGGGAAPRWSRDGRELYFEDLGANRVAVPVRTAPTFIPGTPTRITGGSLGLTGSLAVPYYDFTPDGRRLIGARVNQGAQGGSIALPIVVDHWTSELFARMKADR
jgi:Tol biopolymer transport system component/tRNA A-37 threonylcarbamoyl transferase component Bud32